MVYSNNVLQNVAFEIKRDRQPDAELIRKQRLLGIQMNHDPAKNDRMNNGRTSIGKRRQGNVRGRVGSMLVAVGLRLQTLDSVHADQTA